MSAGDYHRLKDYSDAEDGIVNRARDSPTEWTTSSSTEPVLIPSKQHKTLSYRQKKGRFVSPTCTADMCIEGIGKTVCASMSYCLVHSVAQSQLPSC